MRPVSPLKGVFRSDIRRRYGSSFRRRVLFMGTDDFSVESLKALKCRAEISGLEVLYSPPKPVTHPHAVRDFALANDIPCRLWPDEVLQTGEFDLGVVASFGFLLPKKFIQKFPLGVINVHASLLPRWRGASPIIYAILNGDTETGITIMKIKPHRFDKGDILASERYPINPHVCSKDLTRRLAVVGGEQVVRVINDLEVYTAKAKPQSLKGVTYAPAVKSKETFFVDFSNNSSLEIYNQWRALNDIGRLRSTWKSKKENNLIIQFPNSTPVLIEDEDIINGPLRYICWSPESVTPGLCLYLRSRNLIAVKAASGWIAFDSLLVGSKNMQPKDFFNGFMNKHKTPMYFSSER